eukprot:TRINITY_DN34286_c0_g1_i2.p1 TRINITY_DN34286_c0_g1~~TRINITY_DN34286_c0_g1_i2.p1  ORF type:complete len:247 (+),score=44.90 TRINITY_DN34286_c0_g1_i2:118-858(+)
MCIRDRYWARHLLRNQSVVVDNLHGQWRSEVFCMSCGHTSVIFEAFTSLSLLIPASEEEPATLQDCFKHFSRSEELSDDDLVYCTRCEDFKKQCKKVELWKLPQVLSLHLRRVGYGGLDRSSVDAPTCLDLAQHVVDPHLNLEFERTRTQCLLGIVDPGSVLHRLHGNVNVTEIIMGFAKQVLYDLVSYCTVSPGTGGPEVACARSRNGTWHRYCDSAVSVMQKPFEDQDDELTYLLMYEARPSLI